MVRVDTTCHSCGHEMNVGPLYEIALFDRLSGWKKRKMSLCQTCTRRQMGSFYINLPHRVIRNSWICFICGAERRWDYPYCVISKYDVSVVLWISDGDISFCSPECLGIVAGNDFF